jgi:hypothetical protein
MTMQTGFSTTRLFEIAFEREIIRDRIGGKTVPPGDDVRAAAGAARQAWRTGDLRAFVPLARGLRGAGHAKPVLAQRLAQALIQLSLFEEALDVLADPPARDAKRSRLQAVAHLALAHSDEVSPADLARLAEPDDGAGAGAAMSGSLTARSLVPETWGETAELMRRWVELGLVDQAVSTLRAWLERCGDGAGRELAALMEAAICLLQVGASPAEALALLRSMRRIYECAGEHEAYASALEAITGADKVIEAQDTFVLSQEQVLMRTCLAAVCAVCGRWGAAAARVPILPRGGGVLAESLHLLARCTGQDLLSRFELRFAPPGPPRIFNLSPFNNEFDQLEMKLEEMAPWVDRFVIVEACRTFTGRAKPLHFLENRDRFSRFADKIIHVPLTDYPDWANAAWQRDFFQRDSAVRGLSGVCAPDDLVIISDTDEIVRKEAAARAIHHDLVGGETRTFAYFFNCEKLSSEPKVKPAFVRAGLLARHGSSYLRLGAGRHLRRRAIRDAGWHFTSIADAAGLADKCRSWAHTEWSHLDQDYFEKLLDKLNRGKLGETYVRRDLDDDMPSYLLRNRERLASLLLL